MGRRWMHESGNSGDDDDEWRGVGGDGTERDYRLRAAIVRQEQQLKRGERDREREENIIIMMFCLHDCESFTGFSCTGGSFQGLGSVGQNESL